MSGFEKQTYTQVPNSLFEIMHEMDECELKVVLYICRYTFGYHRDEVRISTRKLADAIKMSVASVDKGGNAAVERGLIERVTDGQNTTVWRAIVSDSKNESPADVPENETPVTQKVEQSVPDNESQVGVKESIKKDLNKRGDLVDALLDLSQSPGMKRTTRIDSILSYLAGKLKINTETKRWKDFAKFADDRQQAHHEPLDIFVSWLMGQKNFDVQFWPPSKMQEMWPQAFLLEAQPNTPQINEARVEETKKAVADKWNFTPAPPPVNLVKPALKQPERRVHR
jgi:phage replication O-like protein O